MAITVHMLLVEEIVVLLRPNGGNRIQAEVETALKATVGLLHAWKCVCEGCVCVSLHTSY